MAYRPGARPLTADETLRLQDMDGFVPRTPSGLRRYKTEEGLNLLAEITRLHTEGSVPLDQFAQALGCSRQAIHYAIKSYRSRV